MIDGQPATQPTEPAPTIWSELDRWAQTLPLWQQCIVGTAIFRGKLSDQDVDEVYARFLRSGSLASTAGGDETSPPALGIRPVVVLTNKLVLGRIDGLAGINALPAGAALTFGPGLTVIYGRNGAGKSGFARLMANACFSRQQPPIVGDIYADGEPPKPTALFHVSVGGVSQEPILFSAAATKSELRRITVFDAAVARHHITEAAAFDFKPAGFDVFPEMVRIYGLLLSKLDQDIAVRAKPNEFSQSFLGGGTDVHAAVAGLGPNTDLVRLRKLAQYGDAESARITELDKQIIALRSQSPAEIIASLKETLVDIQTLREQLVVCGRYFDETAIEERQIGIRRAREALAVAAAAGSDQFKRPFFRAVGTSEWETFAASVHALARKEGEDYPGSTGRCLLCERELDGNSHAHVEALLAFVESDTRKAAKDAQDEIMMEAAVLSRLDLNMFSSASRVRTHVHRLDPALESMIEQVMVLLTTARDLSVADLTELTANTTAVDLTGTLAQISEACERVAADITRLAMDNTEAAIGSLESERRTLRHKHVLAQLLSAIEAFVVDAQWVERATAARRSLATRPITDKEKDLSVRVIGDSYRVRLTEECSRLGCTVPIELQTMGRSGQTMRALAMKGGHKPDAILSEGEQKVVALADFLTEVALNPASAGIVFDDPVTSQDHQRKELIACRLAEEALSRQVIIFTHDLVFLNQLFVAADATRCDLEAHWVDRGPDGRPGQVALGDSPITSRAYETTRRAADALSRARTTTGAEREDAIRKGMGALRTTLEETVVKRVFKDAVPRWSDQVRVTTLRRINWDNAKIGDICNLYEDLSRFIEGHSHTDESVGAPAQISELETRIELVNALIKWARADRQKEN